MARVDLNEESAAAPQESVPQISGGEGEYMQRLLDSARGAESTKRPSQPPPKVRTQYEEDAEVDEISLRLKEFFRVSDNLHTITLTDEKDGTVWEFVVKNIDASHFISGSLKIIDPSTLKETSDGYMELFKEMYRYFLRALVSIKNGKRTITPELLVRGMPQYNPGYYDTLGKELASYLNLKQLTHVVLEYSKYFNEIEVPATEKKIP